MNEKKGWNKIQILLKNIWKKETKQKRESGNIINLLIKISKTVEELGRIWRSEENFQHIQQNLGTYVLVVSPNIYDLKLTHQYYLKIIWKKNKKNNLHRILLPRKSWQKKIRKQ